MDNKGDFLAGVFIGGILGAVGGILFAPSSGEETRTQIADKGREYKEVAAEKALEKSQEAISATKDLVSTLKDRFSNSQEIQQVLDQVDEGLSDK